MSWRTPATNPGVSSGNEDTTLRCECGYVARGDEAGIVQVALHHALSVHGAALTADVVRGLLHNSAGRRRNPADVIAP